MRTLQEQISKEQGIVLLEEMEILKESLQHEKRPRSASKKLQIPTHNAKKIKTAFFADDGASDQSEWESVRDSVRNHRLEEFENERKTEILDWTAQISHVQHKNQSD